MTITLVTCTYNAEAVLQRTLDSVLNQTYPNIEHIIVDGKSSDETIAIAEQYKTTSSMKHTGHRISIFSDPDKGLYDAMNKGIGYAHGKYLCFLNAGDILYSNDTIAHLAEKVSGEKEYSVVYGETDIVDEQGKFICHRKRHAPEHLTWKSFKDGMLVCHQAFYANTELAKATPYNLEYRFSADVDWCIRIMKAGEKRNLDTLNTKEVLCKYLAGGMSIKNHRASLQERFNLMRKHYGLFTTIFQHMKFLIARER